MAEKDDSEKRLSRRRLLEWSGASLLVGGEAAAQVLKAPPGSLTQIDQKIKIVPGLTLAPTTFQLIRPDDLLALELEPINLAPTGNPQKLTFTNPAQPGFLVVWFPGQHIGEQAFPDPPGAMTSSVAASKLAERSRLVFRVPVGSAPIPFTTEGILVALTQLELNVADTAREAQTPFESILVNPDLLLKYGQIHTFDGVKFKPVTRSIARDLKLGGNKNFAQLVVNKIPPILAIPLTRNAPYAPEKVETAITLPYRLILSPTKSAGFTHSTTPKTAGGRTELWHTRMGQRVVGGGRIGIDEDPPGATGKALRAIWSPDYNLTAPPTPGADGPFKTSLNPRNRHELVGLTADFTKPGTANRYIDADRLMLSALGGWLDSLYASNPPAGYNLEAWRHRAAMGRDQYVRVVEKGYLMPFGHRASLVTITERKFVAHPDGGVAAALLQRKFLLIRERERTYPLPTSAAGRPFPLQRITLTTKETPSLDNVTDGALAGLGTQGFFPRVGGRDFLFHVVAEDAAGERSELSMPLAFVYGTVTENAGTLTTAINGYNAATARRTIDIGGQTIAYAPSARPADTTVHTSSLTFGAVASSGAPAKFGPQIKGATVQVPAVQELTGTNLPLSVTLDDVYLAQGFTTAAGSANVGEVFLKVVPNPLAFSGAVSGIVNPNMSVTGLSRRLGPVSGAKIQQGTFDPSQYFGAAVNSRILGDVRLKDILGSSLLQSAYADETDDDLLLPVRARNAVCAPDADQENRDIAIPRLFKSNKEGERAGVTLLDWETTNLQNVGTFFTKRAGCKLKLRAEARFSAEAKEDPIAFKVKSELSKFQLDFFSAIILKIDKLGMAIDTEKGIQDVDFGLADGDDAITFGGPLSFVNELRQTLFGGSSRPASGGSGGGGGGSSSSGGGGGLGDIFKPVVEPSFSPLGIKAGIKINIPTIQLGVMQLSQLQIGAVATIAFIEGPWRLRCNLSERDKPCMLSYLIFTGGIFFAITLAATWPESGPSLAVERIEAALEFGASYKIDIGVASGGIYAMVGIYFEWDGAKQLATLTGYVRVGGSLKFLGIVTISIELYLSLTYQSDGKCAGEARFTVKIEILFFSVSVTATARKEFASGSGGGGTVLNDFDDDLSVSPRRRAALCAPAGVTPPKLKDHYSQNDWAIYCDAFGS